MKQPKFRGVSKETNNIIYGFGWCESGYTDEFLKELGQENQDAYLYTESSPVVCHIDSMGQYVGEKDDNNVEIYTGDLVEVVIGGYTQSSYYLVNDIQDVYLWTECMDSYYRVSRVKIVGNKFKNPELNYIVPEF